MSCKSKPENLFVPVHESQDSTDDMVRTHISMKSRDGGRVSDGRDRLSEGRLGKGMSSFQEDIWEMGRSHR